MPYFGTPQMCNVVGEDEHHTCDECRFSSAPKMIPHLRQRGADSAPYPKITPHLRRCRFSSDIGEDEHHTCDECRFSSASEDDTTLAAVCFLKYLSVHDSNDQLTHQGLLPNLAS